MTGKRILICALAAVLLLSLAACGEEPTAAPEPDPAMPVTTEQILRFYNDSLGRAVDGTLSFAGRYRTDNDKFNLSPVLAPFKSELREALEIGRSQEVIFTPESARNEPYTCYLQRPSLTPADVTKAVCTLDEGGSYHIELYLIDGESHASPETDQYACALDRCGIAAGDDLQAAFDHITARRIYKKVSQLLPDIKVDEKQTDAAVDALFRPDGTPVQLSISFQSACSVRGVYGVGLSAVGTTKIAYFQFGAESPAFPEEDE